MGAPAEKTFAEIVAVFKQETDKAVLISIDKRDVWIPKSQMEDASEEWEKDSEYTFSINTWILDKQGVNYDPTA